MSFSNGLVYGLPTKMPANGICGFAPAALPSKIAFAKLWCDNEEKDIQRRRRARVNSKNKIESGGQLTWAHSVHLHTDENVHNTE